ncbi:MAG: FAD-dependent monooxygenase [Pseudomonadota bacterium]
MAELESKSPPEVADSDIIVVGAGPAGASLALLTAGLGFETVLIDARPSGPAPRRDPRNFAIVRGSWRLLQAAGVTDALEQDAQPLNGLQAMDGATHLLGTPEVMFSNEDLGTGETLGFMVEAERLQSALDERLSKPQDSLTILRPSRFEALTHADGGVCAHLGSGDTIKAKLIAGCDGVNSPVRAALGIPVEGRDYGKSVFAADVSLARPHGGIARQLFTPEGPFATLPLTGDRANLAWYMKSGAAEALAKRPKAEIEAELNTRFSDFAGEMALIGPALSYPLKLQIAETMAGGRGVLVGDAARRINPLAGQGLNLGFKDVGALVEVISDARSVGLDIGAPAALERYQTWRRFDAAATAMAMDGIDRAFSNDNALLKPLRTLSMLAANGITPLRKALSRQASADQKSLPKLLRGEALG